MKKINLFFILSFVISLCLQSCNNSKTYAEMKEEEADAIDAFILENDFKVISEQQFYSQDTMTNENEFVLFDESGVYMNILQKGKANAKLADGYYQLLSRFVEVAIQDRSDLFAKGDTLLANMKIVNASYLAQPEEYKVTVSEGTYSGTFQGYSLMYSTYSSASVPSGWLLPLKYLRPQRTQSASDVARVRLIVPHSEGTYNASMYVYPAYYEITYNLGK